MNMRCFIMLLLLILLPYSYCECPNSITIDPVFSSSTCTFQYQPDNEDCIFTKCMFGSRTLGWKECLNQCCVQTDFEAFDDGVQLVRQCQLDNSSKKKWVLGMSIGLSFSMIGLVIIILICFKNEYCPLFKLRQRLANPTKYQSKSVEPTNENAPVELKEVSIHSSSRNGLDINKQNVQTIWKSSSIKDSRLLMSRCSICKMAKVQCWLPCDHYFHTECIGRLKDHKLCCVCNSQIKFVHLFCSQCREDLKIISIKAFKSLFKKGKSFNCQKCRNTSP